MKQTLGVSSTTLPLTDVQPIIVPRNDSLFMMSEELNELLEGKETTNLTDTIAQAWTCNVKLVNNETTVEGAMLEAKNDPRSSEWFTIKVRVDASRGMNFFLHSSTQPLTIESIEFMSSSETFNFNPRKHELTTCIESFDNINGLATLTLILRT